MKAPLHLLIAALAGAILLPDAARADSPAATLAPSPWIALARGRIEPAGGIIQVASARDGLVKSLLVSEGDHVTQGQPLVQLTDDDARLNLALAQREAAQAGAALTPFQLREAAARREVQRLAPLVADQLANAADLDRAREQEALAKSGLDEARAASDAARARLDIARHEVDARIVRAPVAGRILRCLVKPGEGVSTQLPSTLFWLAPHGPLTVVAQLDEPSARLIKAGDQAEIVPDSSNDRVATARVQSVGLVFGPRRPATDDPAERQDLRVVDCRLTIEGHPDGLLIGERVVVRFLRAGSSAR